MFKRLFGRPQSSAIRLCVLGNSHVGALRWGWNELESKHSGIEITFFSSPGLSTRQIKLSNSRIVPKNEELAQRFAQTSGGKKEINPADYDVFLCYGTFGWRPLVKTPLSASFAKAILEERLGRANQVKHLSLIRQTTRSPIFVATAPLLLSAYKERGTLVQPIAEQRQMLQRKYSEDHQADLVWQPDETLVDDGTATRDCFSLGYEGLDLGDGAIGRDADDDISHMNKAYGVAWLNAFLPRLAQLGSRAT